MFVGVFPFSDIYYFLVEKVAKQSVKGVEISFEALSGLKAP